MLEGRGSKIWNQRVSGGNLQGRGGRSTPARGRNLDPREHPEIASVISGPCDKLAPLTEQFPVFKHKKSYPPNSSYFSRAESTGGGEQPT